MTGTIPDIAYAGLGGTQVGMFTQHAGGDTGFAVVDLETTGLYPSTDRVVEVGIVQLTADADVTTQFCTLINPGRDVGPTRLHGISATNVYDAPTFAAAAATIWQLLTGRILVAHNADFDTRFLEAEFNRCGVTLPPPPVMCTMRLASYYLAGLPARSLPACCAAAGVTLSQHHNALCDAQAAAGLLARYRAAHQQLPDSWAQALTQAARTPWVPAPRPAQFRPATRQQQTMRRASQRPPLADLVDRLPRGSSGDTDTYLGVLDRVLEDRIISADEVLSLSGLAAELGLKHDTAQRAHRQYLHHVAAAAWADGHVTDTERADLRRVAHLLGIPTDEALTILDTAHHAPQHPSGHLPPTLHPGDRVVFTGDMDMARADIENLAKAAGLRVTTAVSAKTALVVAADPYSQSGKANTARQLGVRLVTEQVFLHLLDRT
jgi:DNA polymerase III subunit epsilon